MWKRVETGEQIVKDMEFNFVELPKFKLTLPQLHTLVEQWVYFIKNAENLTVVPDNIHDEGLQLAYEEAQMHAWTAAELDAYDYTFMREEDGRAILDMATRKAHEAGIERGREQEKISLVLGMHVEGLSIAQIARIAKLPDEEVTAIIAQHSHD